MLRFWVPGHPKTKGSLEVVNSGRLRGRPVLRDTPQSSNWRKLVAYQADQAMRITDAARAAPPIWPLAGAVGLVTTYILDCTPDELIEQGSGDGDKLDRNVWDALADAGVYGNDAQVVSWVGDKISIFDVDEKRRQRGPGLDVRVRLP